MVTYELQQYKKYGFVRSIHVYKKSVLSTLHVCNTVPINRYGRTGPKTPFEHAFEHISARTVQGPQNVGRSPTCGHFQDGHMVADGSDQQ